MKYRVYDKNLKAFWDYFIDMCGNVYDKNINDNDCYELIKQENCVIQSFIGLTDKNGKEIYEGDIVKIEKFNIIGEVVYFKNYASFVVKVNNLGWFFNSDFDNKDIKVIGNIFKNKELLK